MIVVTVTRNRQIQGRPNQTHAEALLPTALSLGTLRALERGEMRVRRLYKEVVAHDPDGRAIGRRREEIGEITLVRAEVADVLDLSLDVALACGFKALEGFRDAWRARHPHSDRALVVWFALGDWRDRDVFMTHSGRAASEISGFGSGYTRNSRRALDSDAPVLSRKEIEALVHVNHQKDDARRAKASAALAAETPAQRWLRIERLIAWLAAEVGEEAARQVRQEIRQHRRVIEQRVQRAKRRS